MTARAIIHEHDGIGVVRDDLFPGGTKARFLAGLFDGVEEVVYASPAEGGAQTAIATIASQLGKRAAIFVAKRATPHPRSIMAKRLGASVYQVSPGYLAVVQARAREYAAGSSTRRLVPFGADVPWARTAIAEAVAGVPADEVWCAAGSGVLARGIALAWPQARRYAVQVGRALTPGDVAGAAILAYPRPFGAVARAAPPFPSDLHYDAKAWELATARRGAGRVIFWNVTGPAS